MEGSRLPAGWQSLAIPTCSKKHLMLALQKSEAGITSLLGIPPCEEVAEAMSRGRDCSRDIAAVVRGCLLTSKGTPDEGGAGNPWQEYAAV